MPDEANPLLPTAYDAAWSVLALVAATLLIIAVISIGRHRAALTSFQTLVWVLLAIFLPVIGPVAWLVAGRPARSPQSRPTDLSA